MLLDDVLHDRKAEACSGALSARREERLEDPIELGLWNPDAVVLDLDPDAIVTVGLGGQAHPSAFFGRSVACVRDEIDEDLMELSRHCVHLRNALSVVELHGDACFPNDVLAEPDSLLEHVVESGWLCLFLRGPRVGQ